MDCVGIGILLAGSGLGLSVALGVQPLDHTRLDRPTITPADMRHIEAVRRDRSPLADFGRTPPASLRIPQDFKSVYQVPTDASHRYGGWFARPSGGVMAVYPRGQYDLITFKDKRRKPVIVPVVPPGTIYFIGGIPRTYLDRPSDVNPVSAPSISGYVDGLIDLSAGGEAPHGHISLRVDEGIDRPALHESIPQAPAPVSPDERLRESTLRTFTDPVHRNRRVDALFMIAAQESGRSLAE